MAPKEGLNFPQISPDELARARAKQLLDKEEKRKVQEEAKREKRILEIMHSAGISREGAEEQLGREQTVNAKRTIEEFSPDRREAA